MPKHSRCIYNRSPFAVSVKNRGDLYREFPAVSKAKAYAYALELENSGFKPSCSQLANAFQLLLRRKGFPGFAQTFPTLSAAEETLDVLRGQHAQKIYVDYSASLKTTLAQLIERYIKEECPKHKGGDAEASRLRGWLEDSHGRGHSKAARREVDEAAFRAANPTESGKEPKKRPKKRTEAKRDFIENLEFLHKPLAALMPTDFEDFILGRLEQVAPGTVNRELDLFSQVINTADKTWRIRCAENPMYGVRRPRYFNERNRRLDPDEELRLYEAARNDENPFLEPAIRLLIQTLMRSSELVGARWEHVDYERRSLWLPDTKNGHPRRVPLTGEAIQVLRALPVDSEYILPLTANALKKGWERIIDATGILDLHKHDLRHEGISRFAETGKFSILDLQAMSGHRDIRMLQRYSHLCTKILAERMDAAVAPVAPAYEYFRHGRKRVVVKPNGTLPRELTSEPLPTPRVAAAKTVQPRSKVIPIPQERRAA